ncbi:MAG TPA: glycerophosphodiester phosphodiesterase family protein, partial [Pyrinomonadaceae bacterium]|nr:glycerophosphodiester phosphodiesterase family protein [Pyrinomonadaceae bacterium]
GADELALHWSLVTRRMVKTANAANLPVVVWTVDAPRWVDRALGYQLHALITNRPAPMRARLDWLGTSAPHGVA